MRDKLLPQPFWLYVHLVLLFLAGLFLLGVGTIQAQEADGARVVILEADAANTISRNVAGEAFEFSLTLTESSRQANIDDLQVTLGPLTHSNGLVGQPATITLSPQGETSLSLSLPPGGRRSLTLQGSLPEVGSYSSYLFLDYGDQSVVYTLTLTRQAPPEITIFEASNGQIDLPVGGPEVTHSLTLMLPSVKPTSTIFS